MTFQIGERVLWLKPNEKAVVAEVIYVEPNSPFAEGRTLYLIGPLPGEDTISFFNNNYVTEKYLSKLPDPNDVIKTIV